MQPLSFHSEQPSSRDLFPGSSHERVAEAIFRHILRDTQTRIIGLDGEFGSGKSSILKMLEIRISNLNNHYKLWTFDCEQNYQGSIKSNFIELFTDEVISNLREKKQEIKIPDVEKTRDIALGRHLTYSKETNSKVSPWAIALLASFFVASTFLKELLSVVHQETATEWWWYLILGSGIASPAIIFFLAWLFNRNRKLGRKKWSLLSLFKGTSDDYISETIEVSKDVSPLDLKKALLAHLDTVADTSYVVVLDNLDRLPKDSLRTVWSDLEIFTSPPADKNFHVIVPFCSSKVAKYLDASDSASYDSKDFIAKKFPVVFRAPPIITSGWRDTFKALWKESFGDEFSSEADHCGTLLQRHSPMENRLVTPRLQKRFLNDIATTALVTEGSPNPLCIAAYILLCKYNSIPIETVLNQSSSDDKDSTQNQLNLDKTKSFLTSKFGSEMESGWPIQFLQIHFQTSSDIAVAELLDAPLTTAIENIDTERLGRISTMFGFLDGFRRVLEKGISRSLLMRAISESNQKLRPAIFSQIISELNSKLINDPELIRVPFSSEYTEAIKTLTNSGLDKSLFTPNITSLRSSFIKSLGIPYAKLNDEELVLEEYDAYLYALDEEPPSVSLDSAEVLYHLVLPADWLQSIEPEKLKLTSNGIESAIRQICSNDHVDFGLTPLNEDEWEPALCHAFKSSLLTATKRVYGLNDEEFSSVNNAISSAPTEPRLWVALALTKNLSGDYRSFFSSYVQAKESHIRMAMAIVCLRLKDYSTLESIQGVEDFHMSDFFVALIKAAISFEQLCLALRNEGCAEIIAPLLAKVIAEDSVYFMNTNYLYSDFSRICRKVKAYNLTESDVCDWIDKRWPEFKLAPELESTDSNLVAHMLSRQSGTISKLKQNFLDYFSADTTMEYWTEFFEQKSVNALQVLRYMAENSMLIKSKSEARGAILNKLQSIAELEPYVRPDEELNGKITAVLNCLDRDAQLVMGTSIRTLVLDSGTSLAAATYAIEVVGHLIPDAQPADVAEAGRLLQILEFIHDHPDSSTAAATFFDARAEELTRFNYSKGMKEALGSITAKMKDRLPNLYGILSEKRGFKTLIRRFLKN